MPTTTPRIVALLFPVVAFFPALVVSLCKYWGGAPIHEPFSAYSNLSYILGAMGLLLLPFLTHRSNPNESAIGDILLLLLGSASLLFHANGSKSDTWESSVDRMSMFLAMGYFAVIVFGGIASARIGRPLHPSSLARALVSLLSSVMLIFVVLFQSRIDTLVFFLATGIPLFSGTFCINLLITRHISRHAVFAAFGVCITQVFLLACGYALLRMGGGAIDDDVQYDFCHGSWHVLTAIVLSGAIVTIYCAYTQYDELMCRFVPGRKLQPRIGTQLPD